MFSFRRLALIAGILFGLSSPTPASAGSVSPLLGEGPGVRPLALAGETVATTYTVWYQQPGQRWTGISGLSYYDGCRIGDNYLRRGWRAYIERESSRLSVRSLGTREAETSADEREPSDQLAVRSTYYVAWTY